MLFELPDLGLHQPRLRQLPYRHLVHSGPLWQRQPRCVLPRRRVQVPLYLRGMHRRCPHRCPCPDLAPTLFPTRVPGQPQPFFPGQNPNFVAPTGTPCDWLSEGSLYSAEPHCVANCLNFPDRSCVKFGQSNLCPASGTGANNYNTGTCARRCNSIGTGRGTGINNNANSVPTNTATTPIECCSDFPGDYCCDGWGQLQAFCSAGRVPNGPICGIIIRGTAADPNYQNGFGVLGQGVGFGEIGRAHV